MTSVKLKKLQQYLTTIAQPMRFDILLMLRQGELCVCDLYQRLGIAQNLTSHHLKVLVDLKLLTSRKVGLKVLYTRNEATIATFQTLLETTISVQNGECQKMGAKHAMGTKQCCKGTARTQRTKLLTKNVKI